MAATAGSVAVGSTIGHGLSSMLFGGSSNASAPVEAQAPPVQQQQGYQANGFCEDKAKGLSSSYVLRSCRFGSLKNSIDFSKCLEKADLQSCGWYFDQLKAVCQIFISQF